MGLASFISLPRSETFKLSHQHWAVLGKNPGASLGAKQASVVRPWTLLLLALSCFCSQEVKELLKAEVCALVLRQRRLDGGRIASRAVIAVLFSSLRVSLASALMSEAAQAGQRLGGLWELAVPQWDSPAAAPWLCSPALTQLLLQGQIPHPQRP